jgi:hypothetical protein
MRQGQGMPPDTATVAADAESPSRASRSAGLSDLSVSHRLAAGVWSAHQADRAWLDWGICWPPLSVRRPRCVSCGADWPCAPALAADAQMTSREPGTAIG